MKMDYGWLRDFFTKYRKFHFGADGCHGHKLTIMDNADVQGLISLQALTMASALM